jgi:hypothetical protein
MTTRIKLRRDTAANWTSNNPILADGEPGLETDTGKIKYGNGATAWAGLQHAGGDTLTDDQAVTVTVGNTDYFAIVNRANNEDDGVESSAVTYDSEGNLIVLHISEVNIGSNNVTQLVDRLIISKFNSSATLLWQKQIQEDMDIDQSHDVVIDDDDNIIVLYSRDDAEDTVGAIKYTSTGTELWKKDYHSVVLVPVIETFVLDTTSVTTGTFGGNIVDVVTMEGDWSYLNDNTGWSLQESTNSGGTYTTIVSVLGFGAYNIGADTTPLYIAANSGVTLSNASGYAYRVIRTGPNSDLELSGAVTNGTHTFIATKYIENAAVDDPIGALLKISNTDGSLTWAKSFYLEESGFVVRPQGMEIDSNGDLVVTGTWSTPGPTFAYVTKFDGTTGTEVWTRVLSNLEGESSGADITADSQGNVFVSINGRINIVHDQSDTYTKTVVYIVKLNTSGVTQWIRRAGPGPCASVGTGIDCDSLGNVYLSALTTAQKDPNRETDNYNLSDPPAKDVLAIAKYSTAGAVLWQRYIEADGYQFVQNRTTATGDDAPGVFDYDTSMGRSLAVNNSGKLAVQVTVKNLDPDSNYDDTQYWESITFQIDQDGREMTVGSGNEKFTIKESRIPGKFVTLVDAEVVEGGPVTVTVADITTDIEVTIPAITYDDPELAQLVIKSAPYEYVFGNDGTLTIPNDGDIQLTQTQLGWFSVFGPPNNINTYDIDVRTNCVDFTTGDVYIGGEEEDDQRGFVARYNSQGEVLWSIRLFDDDEGYVSGIYAMKINPTTGNLVALAIYDDSNILLVEIDPDTARVVNSAGIRDLGNNSGTYGYDFDFLSDGKIAVVGRKYDEYRYYSVTPVTPGSGVGVLSFLRSNIPGKTINSLGSFYVSGTGITGRVNIDSVNRYPGLTTTVRQGSGATFDIIDNGNGTYSAGIETGGTNYRVGHKIQISGSAIGGVDVTNDITITVDAITGSGIIDGVSNTGTAAGTISTTYTALTGTNYLVGSGCTATLELQPDGSVNGVYAFGTAGTNYVVDDVLTVSGTQFLGGTSPANDITMTVTDNSGGGVGGVNGTNTPSGTGPVTHWRIQTTNQTPDYSTIGTWSIQESLDGEAFVYVGTASGVPFAPVWTKVLSAGGSTDNERYSSVAVDAGNNVYAVGEMIARNNAAGADLNSYWCAVVSKFNSTGVHQWTKALNTSLDDNYAKSVAVRGNTIAVSHYNDDNGRTVITKLDATGAVKWQRDVAGGSDSSVAVDTNGDIYAAIESFSESQYNQCIRIVRLNTYGEVVWRKILATHIGTNGQSLNDYLREGRNLHLDATHLYVSGITTAFDNEYDNGFLVKLPKSGDCDGIYGAWTVMMDAYDVDKINSTRATAFTPNIGTGEFETWNPDFESNWWDPSNGDSHYHTLSEIRDRDGGAIEFADGTRQTSSAQQIPQRAIFNGADHRLSLEDMGKHIYITDNETRIAVPYHEDVPLPIGFTVVIINNSGGTVSIDGDGFGTINIKVPGVGTETYWNLADPGMATLIKVDNSTWFMTGNVAVATP